MYAALEPDEFETGEEGDIEEEDDEPETLEEVPALIDVPAGAVGDVIDEMELLRLRRTYAGAVTLMDKWLGVLYDALRAQGRLDDTLVVFTSDQGEPLGEHGYVRRFRPWLYDELIHTPLIVRMPGGEARRRAASGARADGRPAADGRRGAGAAADRGGARPRPADARSAARGRRSAIMRAWGWTSRSSRSGRTSGT